MKNQNINPTTWILSYWLFSSGLYIILAALFIIATFTLPIGFYSALRYIVSYSLMWSLFWCIMLHNQAVIFTNEAIGYSILGIKLVIIILFNTFRPFYFSKNVWVIIDIVCAAVMISITIYNFVCICKEQREH